MRVLGEEQEVRAGKREAVTWGFVSYGKASRVSYLRRSCLFLLSVRDYSIRMHFSHSRAHK